MNEQSKEEKLRRAREYKALNREKLLEQNRAYNKKRVSTPDAKLKKLEQNRASAKRNYGKRKEYDKARDKQKLSARGIVRNRIYRGTMIKMPCEKCGDKNSHAHHDDYSKPLDVRWLCPIHHKETHNV